MVLMARRQHVVRCSLLSQEPLLGLVVQQIESALLLLDQAVTTDGDVLVHWAGGYQRREHV